ncbi:MAG: hypothetical protein LBV03_06560 [Fusobacteriales bacterium]|nr:hypothetical protein [Fusobacteriales bacterium]
MFKILVYAFMNNICSSGNLESNSILDHIISVSGCVEKRIISDCRKLKNGC